MDRRDFVKVSSVMGSALSLGPAGALSKAFESRSDPPIRPGDPEWPVGWASYDPVASFEEDIADLQAHGVGLIDRDADTAEEARELLEVAQRTGMKYHISTLEDVTDSAPLVEELGFEPHPARMIGGVYRGKAIDRHLFRFAPTAHRVIIEPPVYDMGFPYTRGSGGTGPQKDTVPVGHYYPDMGAPVKAEVVVPLKPYDGEQHLKAFRPR
jgi:hypothetical protein